MLLRGGAGRDVLKGGNADDILYGFGGNDTLIGAGGHDVLAGHEGADSLSGGVGDDYMLGGADNDTIDGGAGNDWAAYEDATSAVKVDLTLITAQNTLGAGIDKITGVENLYGSAFDDTLIGNAEVNYLHGGWGRDSLSGGAGDDHLEAGMGDDTLDGGDGIDTISFDGFDGVQVNIGAGGFIGSASAGDDQFRNIENVYGSASYDTFTISGGSHYVAGQDGMDWFNLTDMRTPEVNWLNGGSGSDLFNLKYAVGWIDGGEHSDWLEFRNADAGVRIDLAAVTQINGGLILEIHSIENVRGSGYSDTLYVNDAQNTLDGGGALDVFVFRSLAELGNGETCDTVANFYAGSTVPNSVGDKIDLSAIDANTTVAGNQAFTVVSAFTHQAGQMVISGAYHAYVVTMDVNGDGVADASLKVQMMGMFPEPYSPLEGFDFIL